MRSRDIKADVAYATCNGIYVVPQNPIDPSFWVKRTYDKKLGEHVETIEREEKRDPWGGCQRATKPIQTGLIAKCYDVDRDGVPLEDSVKTVVIQSRDIVGLWVDYLALYADTVRRHADQKTWRAEVRRLSEEVGAAWRSLVGPRGVAFVQEEYRGVQPAQLLKGIELRIDISDRVQLDELLAFSDLPAGELNLNGVFSRLRELLPEPAKADT